MFKTVQKAFNRKSFLEGVGLRNTPIAFQVGRYKIRHETLAEHRVICYETGILPYQVSFTDEYKNCLMVIVDENQLKEAQYTSEEFEKAVELATTLRVQLSVLKGSDIDG